MSLANSLTSGLTSRLARRIGWLRRSSALRLSLLLSVIFAVGMAVSLVVALSLGREAVVQRVDATLHALAGAASLAERRDDSPAMILRSPDNLQGLPPAFRRAVARGGGTVELDDDILQSDVWRVLVATDRAGARVMVAVPLEESQQTQELMAGVLWTTAAVAIAITLALGFVTGLWAQQRLGRINAVLARLASGDLAARTGVARARDDLDEIAFQLDQTAAALERLVAQTRHLSASLAHDLRTPLARLRARLEMLPDGQARGDALEEASRLSLIFDTIMRIARIEAGQGDARFETVPLGALTEDLAETFGAVVEDSGKQLVLDLDAPGTVFADRAMLVQAIANMIQNALVHGGPVVTLFARDARIGVSDNGQGVDPEAYEEILKPMVQLDAARSTQGSGLGLALVRAVADRHKARIILGPEHAGADPAGFEISLNFAKM